MLLKSLEKEDVVERREKSQETDVGKRHSIEARHLILQFLESIGSDSFETVVEAEAVVEAKT